jgi:hypothetical protein
LDFGNTFSIFFHGVWAALGVIAATADDGENEPYDPNPLEAQG